MKQSHLDLETIHIERLGIHGEGVGSIDGYTVFVEGALPREQVRAHLHERRKTFAKATVVERLVSSSDRIEPICPLFGQCGGCQLMHLEYEKQLEAKRQRVVDALERIGKFPHPEVLACESSPLPLAYRNKIQLPCTTKQGSIRLGLYARNTHDLVEIEGCHIHCSLGEKAFQQLRSLLKTSSVTTYDAQTGHGELRHVLIKTAVHTKQVLVVFVTSGESSPALRSLAQQVMEGMEEIRGVVQNINRMEGNAILGTEYHPLVGQLAIEEQILDLTFKVSPASFFQVNPAQAERLYQKALEFCRLQGDETVLDAYCGVGTLSLVLARQARRVVGVECVPAAIEDARENAQRNRIENVQFTCARAEEYIARLQHVDVVVLNPPRKGCDQILLERLAILRPRTIVYISCDPATLARDLRFLSMSGYQVETVQPFDMFPQTAHVETLVRLKLLSTLVWSPERPSGRSTLKVT